MGNTKQHIKKREINIRIAKMAKVFGDFLDFFKGVLIIKISLIKLVSSSYITT